MQTQNTQQRQLPVMTLRGNVAFPHTTYKIDAVSGSNAYAYADAITSGDDVLLLTQTDMLKEEPDIDGYYRVGTIAKTKKIIQNPDMTRSVIFDCGCRAAVLSLTPGAYFRATVEEMPEETHLPSEADLQAIANLREALTQLQKYNMEVAHPALLALAAADDLASVTDFIAATVVTDYQRKQELLEETNPSKRLSGVYTCVVEELGLAEYEASIRSAVQENIDQNQREYYLREQLKVIQNELGGEEDDEIREYGERIEKAELPDPVREKLQKELARLAKTPYGAADSTVLRNYLDICLDIPWNHRITEKATVTEAEKILNADHDGLDKVKERILEYIAVRQISDKIGGQTLCLIGPPGVGKTSIAISVARALNRPYSRISLGGVRDEADIRGHRKTYVAAMPGRIVDALTATGVMNPVIILDEIDKLSSGVSGDPASALLEVLDPEQNKSFRDHFTELSMDLSDCIFIATANSYSGIPAPLIDRMEIMELSSYTEREKREIAEHHLVPKQIELCGLTARQIRFTSDGILEMIRHYTSEAGVRNLEREIAAVCRKVAKRIAEGSRKHATVTPATVRAYLGQPKFRDEEQDAKDSVGVVNGLAYTSAGGDLLKVEVLSMPGNGKIELTGSLGDVMKESARIAISYVRSIADRLPIEHDFYLKRDLHIHFPEGAIPKDGPSAGITMTCAIVSALTGLPARHDIAMTGEMTLRGKIMPIGGLKEKTMAAYRAGIKTVLIPRQNASDLEEIDPEAHDHLRFVFCDTAEDAISLVINKGHSPVLSAHSDSSVRKQTSKSAHPAAHYPL